MEVSSHALALHRVDGTQFDAVVFTNLGQDHLDLHGSTEEYFRAKARLFDPAFSPLAVINVDDTYGRLLADTLQVNSGRGDDDIRVVPISADDLDDLVVDGSSHSYRWGAIDVTVPIGGHFNVANSHAALVTAVELGVEPHVAVAGLAATNPIPGRFEAVPAATSARAHRGRRLRPHPRRAGRSPPLGARDRRHRFSRGDRVRGRRRP